MSAYPHFAKQLEQLLKKSSRVLLTITKEPDGDSLGSMFAMCHAIQHYRKAVLCYSPDPIPKMFDYLRGKYPVTSDLPDSVHSYDLVIIFDTGDMKRTPLVAELSQRQSEKTNVVNIDHHPTVIHWNGQQTVDHNFIDTEAGATTEMVYKLLEHLQVPLNAAAATSLLTGILTDTGHFSNHGTSLESLDIAAQLMAQGAKHHLITQATMQNKSLGTLKLWGRVLSRLKINPDNGVVSTVIWQRDFEECGVDSKAGTGISNFLNSLGEGRIALVLHEDTGNIVKGSLRTTKDDVNVADIAAKFGGGGHAKAAGFKIRGRLVETRGGWRVEPIISSAPGETA
jgi:phosphoesterase RecJ-like protein